MGEERWRLREEMRGESRDRKGETIAEIGEERREAAAAIREERRWL